MLRALDAAGMFRQAAGIIIGQLSEEEENMLVKFLKYEARREDIPVLSNVDFVHRTPMTVVPMGAMLYGFGGAGTGIDAEAFEPLPIEIYHKGKQTTEKVMDFPCDERLLKLAEKVISPYRTARGVIGSADEWNNQLDRIAMLHRRYKTTTEDMESAATAQLCLSYGVPFIGIRILSNSIVMDEEYDEAVGEDVQKFVISYVEALREF